MGAVDHLIAALVELEHESIEIEHRQSFVRSAIEAFGIDADDALLMAMRAEGDGRPWTIDALCDDEERALAAEQIATPETVRQDGPKSIDDLYGEMTSPIWPFAPKVIVATVSGS